MNNKGVTLIELLIVIVVIGIIAAFAVPAVTSFLDQAEKESVYQDALAVRNAAANLCALNNCDTTNDGAGGPATEYTYAQLSTYLESFDDGAYVTTGTIASVEDGVWIVTLEANTQKWEWVSTTVDPLGADSSTVSED